ncbi:MAG: DUF4292 domain-containing protein [Cellulophaga sp.]
MKNWIGKIGRILVLCLLVIFISSCKTKKIISDGTVNDRLSAKAIIREHYNNQLEFKTLRGRMKINHSDGESSKGFTVSLRMEKDKAIWISAPFNIVRAYITPNRVSFYNTFDNTYFDGDFSYLSNLLGTELDFEKVQNVLLGHALFNLKKEKYTTAVRDNEYELKPKKALNLFKIFYLLEPSNFRMAKVQLAQPLEKRLLEIEYINYQKVNKWIVPNNIVINATEGNHRNIIEITFKNIDFNSPLKFPYKIPKGFKEIILK